MQFSSVSRLNCSTCDGGVWDCFIEIRYLLGGVWDCLIETIYLLIVFLEIDMHLLVFGHSEFVYSKLNIMVDLIFKITLR